MSGSTHLYRHFDAQDRLLYVGISKAAIRRLAQHYSTAKWAASISRVTIETFPTRADAKTAESVVIKTEAPLYNIQENRPEVDSEPITVRLPRELVTALDAWREAQSVAPNRPDVLRAALVGWLRERGYLKP